MANLTPRREQSEIMSLRDAMDKLFEDSFVRPWSMFTGAEKGLPMNIDLYQTDEAVVVEANLPGVQPENIDVRVQGDVLTIKAETKQNKDIAEERFAYKERRYGMIERSVLLPVPVQADKSEAKMENGVLKLTLPKQEEAKVKSIKVKIN